MNHPSIESTKQEINSLFTPEEMIKTIHLAYQYTREYAAKDNPKWPEDMIYKGSDHDELIRRLEIYRGVKCD